MTEAYNPYVKAEATVNPGTGLPLFQKPLEARPPARIPVSKAQLEAWDAMQHKLSNQHLLVLSTLAALGPSDIRDVTDELKATIGGDWQRSTISGRMKELKELGLIELELTASGKPLRHIHMNGHATSSGECWKCREDWKEFIDIIKGGLLL